MKIYVACLAAYNAGRLHGEWIDATSDAAEMGEAVAAMLAKSPVPGAEEYAIHDYDGFPDMGEYPGLDAIAETAGLVELAAEHDLSPAAFKAIADNWHGGARDIREAFGRWVGLFDSFREYADEIADLYIGETSGAAADYVSQYFDFEYHASDLALSYTVIETPDGVAVFYD
jgi:antirestriction protein